MWFLPYLSFFLSILYLQTNNRRTKTKTNKQKNIYKLVIKSVARCAEALMWCVSPSCQEEENGHDLKEAILLPIRLEMVIQFVVEQLDIHKSVRIVYKWRTLETQTR